MSGKTWIITLLIMWAIPSILFRYVFDVSWPMAIGFGAVCVVFSGGKL